MGGYFTPQYGANGVGTVNVNRLLEKAQQQTLALTNIAKQVVLTLEPDEEEETKIMRLGEIVFIDKNADDLPMDYFCESCIIHINRIGFEFEK